MHKLYGIDQPATQPFGRICLTARRLVQTQGFGDGVTRAVEPFRDRALGKLFDLAQAADFSPQGDVHGDLRAAGESDGSSDCAAICRNKSPSCIRPCPGAAWRGRGRVGNESTCVNGAS